MTPPEAQATARDTAARFRREAERHRDTATRTTGAVRIDQERLALEKEAVAKFWDRQAVAFGR